jgi:predicted PurR-regulated permease PerM
VSDDTDGTAGWSSGAGRWVYGAAALAALAALLYSVRSVLSPFVLALLFGYLIWPLPDRELRTRLVVSAGVLLLLWVLEVTGLLLAPFILALILAYILDPALEWLEVRGLPRPGGIAVLALPLIGLLALGSFVLAPAIGAQVSQFIADVPEYVDVVEGMIGDLRSWFVGLGIAGLDERTIPETGSLDAETVARYLERWKAEITSASAGAVLGVGRGVGTALTILGYGVLTPILLYFLLRDWPTLQERLVALIPPQRREGIVRFAEEFDHLLARYLRGQLLLAAVVGITVGGGFWLLGFPYALLLGLLAGALNIVPYLGFIGTAVAASIIALFSGALPGSLLKVAVVLAAQQLVEQILGPRIVGESVGLHPVWVLLALALFSFFFGFVGLLVAVPAAVFIKLLAVRAVEAYRGSPAYQPPSDGGGPGDHTE